MRITEIYASIQGETQYAGLPCTLVRTTGCDLRCVYCDSTHAFHGGREMSIDAVLAEIAALPPRFVLLTGGEPMLQPDIGALADRLIRAGYQVMLETSGAHPLDTLPAEVIRVVDVKTPGSGEGHRVCWDVIDTLGPRDAVKFVLVDEADYDWTVDVVRTRRIAERTEVLLSPVHGRLDPRKLVELVLRDGLRARINVQIHKYIWAPETTGV